MTLHFLNDDANDAEYRHTQKKYVIIASLKRETAGKVINRLPAFSSFDIKFPRLDFENACSIPLQASRC